MCKIFLTRLLYEYFAKFSFKNTNDIQWFYIHEMISNRLLIIFICTIAVLTCVSAEYQIRGHVNLSPNWQRQIFLSTVDKLDNYYKADPSNIIQVGSMAAS